MSSPTTEDNEAQPSANCTNYHFYAEKARRQALRAIRCARKLSTSKLFPAKGLDFDSFILNRGAMNARKKMKVFADSDSMSSGCSAENHRCMNVEIVGSHADKLSLPMFCRFGDDCSRIGCSFRHRLPHRPCKNLNARFSLADLNPNSNALNVSKSNKAERASREIKTALGGVDKQKKQRGGPKFTSNAAKKGRLGKLSRNATFFIPTVAAVASAATFLPPSSATEATRRRHQLPQLSSHSNSPRLFVGSPHPAPGVTPPRGGVCCPPLLHPQHHHYYHHHHHRCGQQLSQPLLHQLQNQHPNLFAVPQPLGVHSVASGTLQMAAAAAALRVSPRSVIIRRHYQFDPSSSYPQLSANHAHHRQHQQLRPWKQQQQQQHDPQKQRRRRRRRRKNKPQAQQKKQPLEAAAAAAGARDSAHLRPHQSSIENLNDDNQNGGANRRRKIGTVAVSKNSKKHRNRNKSADGTNRGGRNGRSRQKSWQPRAAHDSSNTHYGHKQLPLSQIITMAPQMTCQQQAQGKIILVRNGCGRSYVGICRSPAVGMSVVPAANG